MTKIKICGLTRMEDILAVNVLRPDYIGFVFAKSRRQIDGRQAKQLKKYLHPGIAAVGVFVNGDLEWEADLFRQGIIDWIQLHGQEDEEAVRRLKNLTARYAGREVCVIKALSMDHAQELEVWQESRADYLLLDHGTGGSGKAFDHRILCTKKIKKPFFLAGGIRPQNAAKLAETYHPFALDSSSGVETDGVKDKEKIRRMVEAVRTAAG